MPWDHFSNLDEEDVVSLIAYLRALPPIAAKVPPHRLPAPDNCRIYTFWTSRNLERGCRPKPFASGGVPPTVELNCGPIKRASKPKPPGAPHQSPRS